MIYLIPFSNIFAESKYIKKIISDITEFDRKNYKSKFLHNVKIELYNGYIMCGNAEYNYKDEKLFCESNVKFVYISTINKQQIEVSSSYLSYEPARQIAEFYQDIFLVYKSTEEIPQKDILLQNIIHNATVSAKHLILDLQQNKIICRENVNIISQDGQIFCSLIEYWYNENIIKINNTDNINNQLIIISTPEKYKIKTCKANTASIEQNRILLKGKVEIVF
ncbi:MAG: hypothetical protein NZ839_05295 [Endomicrobia bacterium]|nr:hypothetical protein [Endomicrobiia bacterium]